MALPLTPPVLPQLARTAKALPTGGEWTYEPKWDGYRCIAFIDGDGAAPYLQSRNGRDLTRYFPELAFPDGRYVLDGEIVVFGEDRQPDFDMLGQRIHPADSRVQMLAVETPARFIAFDVLSRRRRAAARPAAARAPGAARAARRGGRSTSPRPRPIPPRPSRGCTAPRA